MSISTNDQLQVTFEDEEQMEEIVLPQVSDIKFEKGFDIAEQQRIHTEVEDLNKSFTAMLMNDAFAQTAQDVQIDNEHSDKMQGTFTEEIPEAEFIQGIGQLDISIPESESQEMEPVVRIHPSFTDT